jgi:hypothetical protein
MMGQRWFCGHKLGFIVSAIVSFPKYIRIHISHSSVQSLDAELDKKGSLKRKNY